MRDQGMADRQCSQAVTVKLTFPPGLRVEVETQPEMGWASLVVSGVVATNTGSG